MNEDLQRVKKKLDQHVLDFLASRIAGERQFHSIDLVKHCMRQCHCSPESPARILRLLANAGKVRYTVMNRADSLYRVDFVAAERLELFAA